MIEPTAPPARPPDTPAAGPRRTARALQRIAPQLLTPVACLAAAAPLIASAIRAVQIGWMPAGDQAIIATRAYDVFTSHTPLLGQYSLSTRVTGHLTYSLGPMLYWLLALPARLGSPTAMAVTVAVANALAIAAAVALARRRGGVALMAMSALAMALMCRSFMPEALHDTWNPSAGIFPFTLLLFLGWSLACGEAWLLPLTALVASFAIQCELTYLAPTLAVVAVGLGGLAWGRLRPPRRFGRGRAAAGGGRPDQGRLWPWAAGALVVLALCWAAPAIDQIEHSPGNMSLLVQAATAHKTTLGAQAGARALVRAVGLVPRWLRRPGDVYDNRLIDATSEPGTLAIVSCAAALAALALIAALALWRRRRDLLSAALIGLLLAGAFAAVAADTPLSAVKTLGYTLWWGSPAGMWIYLTIAWAALSLLAGPLGSRGRAGGAEGAEALTGSGAPRRGRPRLDGAAAGAVALAVAAALAGGLAVALGEGPDVHQAEYAPLRAIFARVRTALRRGGTVWVHGSLNDVTEPLKPALTYALRRQGARVIAAGAPVRLGPWYALDHRRYDYELELYDLRRRPPRGFGVVARVPVHGGARSYTLTIALRRGGGRG